jgi:hypothetical protein
VKKRTRGQKNMERQRQDRVSFSEQYADVLAPNSLVYRMKLLSQLMERRFQQMLEPFQLTPLHWAVLCCLWQSDVCPLLRWVAGLASCVGLWSWCLMPWKKPAISQDDRIRTTKGYPAYFSPNKDGS